MALTAALMFYSCASACLCIFWLLSSWNQKAKVPFQRRASPSPDRLPTRASRTQISDSDLTVTTLSIIMLIMHGRV